MVKTIFRATAYYPRHGKRFQVFICSRTFKHIGIEIRVVTGKPRSVNSLYNFSCWCKRVHQMVDDRHLKSKFSMMLLLRTYKIILDVGKYLTNRCCEVRLDLHLAKNLSIGSPQYNIYITVRYILAKTIHYKRNPLVL